MTKKQRETEYKKVKIDKKLSKLKSEEITKKQIEKVQNELKLMAGQPNGWVNIDKKLSAMKKGNLTTNNLRDLKQWVATEKETRKNELNGELEKINDFFEQYKEHPTALRQVGLYKKGLSQSSPMYDSLIESNEMELKEIKIMLKYGFDPLNPQFAWQNDEEYQNIRKQFTERKLKAITNQLEDVKKSLAEVEEELEKEKGLKDKRIAQIKEELKELGMDFPKDELQYIG